MLLYTGIVNVNCLKIVDKNLLHFASVLKDLRKQFALLQLEFNKLASDSNSSKCGMKISSLCCVIC